jgi:hypothetical protein
MRMKVLLASILLLCLLLGAAAGLTMVQAAESERAMASPALVGSGFTYQGKLDKGGSLHTGICDFKFSLHDATSGGNQLGATEAIGTVPVQDGLFTVLVNSGGAFGDDAFNGEARWLGIEVQCAGDSGYTALSPRQALTPSPYALALPGLRTVQNTTSPNLIGGYVGNSVAGGVVGASIGGGGQNGHPNQVLDDFGVVGGGGLNSTDGNAATIGGGWGNEASGHHVTVGGGEANTVEAAHSTVSGGISNTVTSPWATVGGGISNTITANAHQATVGGGYDNEADGNNATISGGQQNTASGVNATVGGGYNNTASVDHATVGGGSGNTASGYQGSTVAGGVLNTASHWYATVGGGTDNTANAQHTTVPGGRNAVASHFGEMAYASGSFAANGDAQTSQYVLRNTSQGSNLVELFLNETNVRLTIAENRTVAFDILVVGRRDVGPAAAYQIRGLIKNLAGTMHFVGTPTVDVLGEDYSTMDAQVDYVDGTYDALIIRAGDTGTTFTGSIRWVAHVRTVEVQW